MTEIAVELSDKAALQELEKLSEGADGFTSERKGMDGMTLCTVVMTLSPLVINGIVKIYQSQQEAKRHVRIKIKGVEIQGVSEQKLLEILRAAEQEEDPS
jgi:DNA-binding transcriptional ArsR family regulator